MYLVLPSSTIFLQKNKPNGKKNNKIREPLRVFLRSRASYSFTNTTSAIHVCYIKFHNSFHSSRRRADEFIFFFSLSPSVSSIFREGKGKKKKRTNVFCVNIFAFLIIIGHKMRSNIMTRIQN